jgi:hypothetical protein
MGLEPTIPTFERAKTVHASWRAATAIGEIWIYICWNENECENHYTMSKLLCYFCPILDKDKIKTKIIIKLYWWRWYETRAVKEIMFFVSKHLSFFFVLINFKMLWYSLTPFDSKSILKYGRNPLKYGTLNSVLTFIWARKLVQLSRNLPENDRNPTVGRIRICRRANQDWSLCYAVTSVPAGPVMFILF